MSAIIIRTRFFCAFLLGDPFSARWWRRKSYATRGTSASMNILGASYSQLLLQSTKNGWSSTAHHSGELVRAWFYNN